MTESARTAQALTAAYTSPLITNTLHCPLPTLTPSPSKQDTISYLSALRKSVTKLQTDVNIFLTRKMEEEKERAVKNGNGASTKVDEQKEEENYGEEVDDEN